MVKIFNKNKYGFSMAEMLISMLVISVFFAASAKIITTRTPNESVKYMHGFFECYSDGGAINVHKIAGTSETQVVGANNCNFKTPIGVNFINVHYVNSDGIYFNSQEPIVDMEMKMNRPEDIMHEYFQNHNPDDTHYTVEREENECFKDDIDDFGRYLNASHPKSKIYEIWSSTGSYPASSLFIAW